MANNKLFSIILGGLLGLSALISVLFAFDVVSEGMLITWCYLLLGVATITAVVFPIMSLAKDLKKAKIALMGIGGLVLLCVISYVLAGSEELMDMNGAVLADSSTSKLSEAGLICFYFLGAIAIGSIIYTEVSKTFK